MVGFNTIYTRINRLKEGKEKPLEEKDTEAEEEYLAAAEDAVARETSRASTTKIRDRS